MTAASTGPAPRGSGPPAVRTWRDVLAQAGEILGSAGDARRLVEHASGLGPAELMRALDELVPARAGSHLSTMVERRAAGEPLQYTLGRWGFRQLDLMVDRRVLIPRPETEQVAGAALDEARRLSAAAGRAALTVADLGTGSGAIALSLALELPGAQVWATDVSPDALAVAGANLCGLAGFAASRVRLAEGSWFDPLPAELRGRLDVVVSNPPYIADDEELPAEVAAWEPAAALRSGPTGLECLAAIVAEAPRWLASPGVLVLELAPHQAAAVRDLARDAGFGSVSILADLSGRDRILMARSGRPAT